MQKVGRKVKTHGLFTFTLTSGAHAAWSASETRSSSIFTSLFVGRSYKGACDHTVLTILWGSVHIMGSMGYQIILKTIKFNVGNKRTVTLPPMQHTSLCSCTLPCVLSCPNKPVYLLWQLACQTCHCTVHA